MKTAEFIKQIQDYYGMQYKEGTLNVLIAWLEKQPVRLDILFQETIPLFSGQYKTLPDIAIFNKVVITERKGAEDSMRNNRFKNDTLQLQNEAVHVTVSDNPGIKDLVRRTYAKRDATDRADTN